MCPATDNAARCKIHIDIRFLHTKNMIAAEIDCELMSNLCQNVLSEGNIRQWCRIFKNGRKNVHDEE
jgi:hypothetical protein